MRGVHPKMQIALKALPSFEQSNINDLASETTRLQLAGIQSFDSENTQDIMNVSEPTLIDAIADKVIEKMNSVSLRNNCADNKAGEETAFANFTDNRFRNSRGRRRGQSRFNRPNTFQKEKFASTEMPVMPK